MGAPVETGGGRLNAGGITTVVTVGYTRPANATLYTAGDVYSNTTGALPIEYKGCARFLGGSGIIQTAYLVHNTFAATKLQVDLLLFDSPRISVAVDNAAFAPLVDEIRTLQCVLSFDGVANDKSLASGSGVTPITGLTQPFQCAPGQTSLWGVLVVRNGYTPTSLEQATIRLGILQD